MGVRRARWALVAIVLAGALAGSIVHAATAEDRFRAANALARQADYPKAIAAYEALAQSGFESAALYWNWAQAAAARGATGEALWALLRARELDPGDRAVRRDIERLREGANLDRAEIAPEPLAALARWARRFRLDLIAVMLMAASLAAHAWLRWRRWAPRLASLAWITLVLGLLVAVVPMVGSLARPTGTVVRRGTSLLDAASPTAEEVGTLREGEVVPILETSGRYVRIEDSSGARGWALAADVRSLAAAPGRETR